LQSHLSCLNGIFGSLFALLLVVVSHVQADDWPQFRGPKRDGISQDKGLLKAWPKDGPPLTWKSEDVGIGFSSVAVVGSQVFTMGDLKDGCYLFAIDRDKGTIQWKVKVGKNGGNYQGPRCTPTVDGQAVYALGQFGDLVCLNVKDGSENWRKNLKTDFKGKEGGWNYTESPLIDGEKLVVTPGGSEAAMLALNKKDGSVIWKAVIPGGEKAGYASIVEAEIGGTRQYIQLMSGGVASFSADKGQLLWRYGNDSKHFAGNTANIPNPVVIGDQIFASAGYGRGGGLITISSAGGKFDVKEEYWSEKLQNRHGGVIRVGENLYGDLDNSGKLWCADLKTGTVKWSRGKDAKGRGTATITYAEGMLYIHRADGWVSLVDPKTSYHEVSAFQIPQAPNAKIECWAHPVVVGGKMFIREREVIWCYDVKGK